jgi:amidase
MKTATLATIPLAPSSGRPSVAQMIRAIDAGQLSCEAVVLSYIERIEAKEPVVEAWHYLDKAGAIDRARRLDRQKGGLLRGIPFGAKDIIDTFDQPTERGSPIFQGDRPKRDAGCIALLREAGAICLGKTVSTELGHAFPGKTRNPHDSGHTPGGSSSGSAAAVGAGMVPFALGTQTTGSVIRPASFCGVVGYKPTYGDFTHSGVYENARSFDTLGVLANEPEDLRPIRAALVRTELAHAEKPDIRDLRIAYCPALFASAADDSTLALVAEAARRLAQLGAHVTDITLPSTFSNAPSLHALVAGFEFARGISWERTQRYADLSDPLAGGRLQDGLDATLADYYKAIDAFIAMRLQFAEIMKSFDVLITPAAPGEAPKGLQATGNPIFNGIWTALYVPVVTIPVFQGPRFGLPIGLQLIGPHRTDERLIDVSQTLFELLGS